ncbi:hypothetical protein C6Q17_19850 [Burkholderia contaminans]|nr:hypothetical protein C6Q17_19850 [Burkholderia contaminans]
MVSDLLLSRHEYDPLWKLASREKTRVRAPACGASYRVPARLSMVHRGLPTECREKCLRSAATRCLHAPSITRSRGRTDNVRIEMSGALQKCLRVDRVTPAVIRNRAQILRLGNLFTLLLDRVEIRTSTRAIYEANWSLAAGHGAAMALSQPRMLIMATILVVDDDESTLHAFALLLEHAGYLVMLARNGQEALAQISEIAVDLVITDWSMPVMDGVTLCRTLHTNPTFSQLPIVLMSANQAPADEGLWRAFLQKPVSWPMIAQTVQSLVTTPRT